MYIYLMLNNIYNTHEKYDFFIFISEINKSPEEDDVVVEIKEKKPIFFVRNIKKHRIWDAYRLSLVFHHCDFMLQF